MSGGISRALWVLGFAVTGCVWVGDDLPGTPDAYQFPDSRRFPDSDLLPPDGGYPDGNRADARPPDAAPPDAAPPDATPPPTNLEPTANAGADHHVYPGGNVTMSGSGSDPDGHTPLTYAWTVTQRPAGSTAALTGATTATPGFTPDKEGVYVLSLIVTDALGKASDADTATVTTWHYVRDLDFALTDAEYSPALGRIVILSGSTLHLIHPISGDDNTIALALPGTSVSVGPDGLHAVVGHDAWLSHVSLAEGKVLAVHKVTAPIGDVVLAGNGYAYAFPSADQWVDLHSIRLSDGFETLSWGTREDTVARLHPGGTSIYAANNGLSPSDIEKYGIGGGTGVRLYDSPYHGDYPMCGDLWLSDDGERIFTRCGKTFWATADKATDMTYAGSLDIVFMTHLDHDGVLGRVAAVPASFGTGGNGTVRIYEDQFLLYQETVGPTSFLRGDTRAVALVRYVFWSADGQALYLLVFPSGGGLPGLVVYSL